MEYNSHNVFSLAYDIQYTIVFVQCYQHRQLGRAFLKRKKNSIHRNRILNCLGCRYCCCCCYFYLAKLMCVVCLFFSPSYALHLFSVYFVFLSCLFHYLIVCVRLYVSFFSLSFSPFVRLYGWRTTIEFTTCANVSLNLPFSIQFYSFSTIQAVIYFMLVFNSHRLDKIEKQETKNNLR